MARKKQKAEEMTTEEIAKRVFPKQVINQIHKELEQPKRKKKS